MICDGWANAFMKINIDLLIMSPAYNDFNLSPVRCIFKSFCSPQDEISHGLLDFNQTPKRINRIILNVKSCIDFPF